MIPRPVEGDGERWHALDAQAVADRLRTGKAGLTQAEAERRLAAYGPNELEAAPPESALRVFFRQFESPLIYILLVAMAITVVLGAFIDAGVIAAAILLGVVIGFFQERRAEESVRALMRLLSPKARVVRDGKILEIESRLLVPGDRVLLESGARVPADIRLDTATALRIDESLLTGESVPVAKQTAPLAADCPLADRSNMAFTGSIVTTGRGQGWVVETGRTTELGAIAETIRRAEKIETPLQQRMAQFSRIVALAILAACVVSFAIGAARGHALGDMFILAVALAVGAIPESLPVILTVTMAVGVRRMARRHAIVRRLPAVETLGSTTVIGSDKTGTLTENRMTLTEVWAGGRLHAIPREGRVPEDEALRSALFAGAMTNEADFWFEGEELQSRGDPTEVALLLAAGRAGMDHRALRATHEAIREVPFEPALKYSAVLRRLPEGPTVFVKGAPETVLAMCETMRGPLGSAPLDPERIRAANRDMASRGLRVLAVAHRTLREIPADGVPVEGLEFLGLVGMVDPPRAGVREAIRGCQEAGMRVLMITGDHADTAVAIGRMLGLAQEGDRAIDGVELARLSDEELQRVVREHTVFARVAPEDKLRIVRALRASGEVVAVTGDGVNDAPALRGADIGIAMGRSGTDVAREASDMVLTDDNFVSIYAAVSEGRITFDNLRKATFFLLSTAAAEIFTLLTALAVGLPSPFLPAQLLWLNLVTNGVQDLALAFEPGEKGILRRPPRPRREGILSGLLWERLVVTGLVMGAGTLFLYVTDLQEHGSVERARTVAMTTMVIYQAFHLGNCRSERLSAIAKSPFSNLFLLGSTAAALAVHVGSLFFGPTQFVLRFVPITDARTWGRMVLVATSILVAIELHKLLRKGTMPLREFFTSEWGASREA
ncbi:MAG TPA: HAD-IC family P-type ATPase [Fredinandcohnia sp.]|nr:HAD-IC family P-type ATPase [Fredinandcohnia sp.]